MAEDTRQLNTEHWQHKRGTVGEIATDIEDIEQCFNTICNIVKGSVTHNPELGVDMMDYMDKPLNIVAPKLKTMYMAELNYQEPRAKVENVSFNADENGFLTIKISYKYEQTMRYKEVQTQWQI